MPTKRNLESPEKTNIYQNEQLEYIQGQINKNQKFGWRQSWWTGQTVNKVIRKQLQNKTKCYQSRRNISDLEKVSQESVRKAS